MGLYAGTLLTLDLTQLRALTEPPDEYCRLRGWGAAGVPSRVRLGELALADLGRGIVG
jgi:hypothetical protein